MSVLDAAEPGFEAMGAAPETGEEPFALPPLRDDLRLMPGPADRQGAPSWTIFDPARHRFFRIGHAAFEMLIRWNLGDSERLLGTVAAETVLRPDAADLSELLRFARANGLLRRADPGAGGEFARIRKAGEPAWWKWMVHNYLFVRIPLVRPDRFLARTQPVADALASGPARLTVAVLGLVGVFLALRQWDAFAHTFMGFANLQGLVWAALTLTGVKILHELAHAYTARRHGCRVPTMGVAFLVLYPVLYTDTSDSWRLTSRPARLAIGAAGIRLELAIALLATFAWSFMPDGPARSAVFVLATATWISTLLINLNPFLRFDGYYLLSDWLDVANLQPRAFALTRWALRETLFGFGLPPPEPMPAGRRRLLVAYGIATWIYRFFLFIAIALIVYHFFFKALGILLFAVEIVWFILLPVAREMRAWGGLRSRFRLNWNLTATLGGLGLIVWLFVHPWDSTIRAPAILEADGTAPILTGLPGRLAAIEAEADAPVEEGAILYRFVSPELDAAIALAEARARAAQVALDQALNDRTAAGAVRPLRERLAGARADLARLAARAERLVLRAPLSGVLRDVPGDLHEGRWMAAQEPLGLVAVPAARLAAYVEQRHLDRVRPDTAARFFPDDPARPALAARVVAIDRLGADVLPGGYLAAPFGGPIEARADAQGALRPLSAVYRVTLALDRPVAPARVERGTVHLTGPPASWAERLWTRIAAIVIRESGF